MRRMRGRLIGQSAEHWVWLLLGFYALFLCCLLLSAELGWL